MHVGINSLSYGLAALAFLALAGLLLGGWSRRRHAGALLLACVCCAAWAALIAADAGGVAGAARWVDVMEVARNAACSFFILRLLGYPRPDARWRWVGYCAGYGAALLLALLPGWRLAQAESAAGVEGLALAWLLAMRTVMAVAGMVLVEQLYRQKDAQSQWAVKYACLGIGGIFAYDFYLYCDAMLVRQVSADIWAARGVVNALTVPLIAVAVARSAAWPSGMLLSRQAMFHSAALLGSAAYLLAMGGAGYYLRYVGGNWGGLIQVGFLFGAMLLLAGVLFSGTFRSRLKVFISKHFYRYDYDYREEWLGFTRKLSQQTPGPAERAIEAVAQLVESPGGALWIWRGGERFTVAAQCRMTVPPAAASGGAPDEDAAFRQSIERNQWVIDLGEPLQRAQVPAWLARLPRARLVVPLMLQDRLFGVLLLQEPRSALRLNWEVIDLLKVAASQVASYLALQETTTALMTARQFESFHRMSTFIVHDLKNLVAQLSLMIPNAKLHLDNPEFQQDMLDTVEHGVQKMKLMLQKLQRSDAPEAAGPVELGPMLARMVAQMATLRGSATPQPVFRCDEPGLSVTAAHGRLERVLGHLLQNAVDATPRDGEVALRLRRDGEQVVVEISDTGQGMTPEFIRERLFKPFESTKAAGMGIGAFESREYVAELGGRLEVQSVPGRGTTFRVVLPAWRAAEVPAIQVAA
ncbi:signal transduction histidine kinase [Duganella sp. CF517]|uniref:XrtA/PEP-CTERM system histidine kinase PrsK n=1 Tax=Duganella sp. CF517 TaxID=1881038 RepID=UPI0008CF7179|nr:XrtA/PEP-CTERM system histidine kinase PrsK [Duganella sp. CF517]SEN84469.1 signal transduction histidine kinase [Duganella sp. CF517]